jgi:hypothetical protein
MFLENYTQKKMKDCHKQESPGNNNFLKENWRTHETYERLKHTQQTSKFKDE